MVTLNAEHRKTGEKSNRLRRENYVPAILYGKHLSQSIPLKLPLKETEQFLRSNTVGSRLQLMCEGESHTAMLKELAREPSTGKLEHLSFVALRVGEKVKGVAHIVITGREALQRKGVVLQTLSEINYRALPSQLVDVITVNVENLEVNENIKVSDLEIANNPEIELLTPADSVVVTVSPIRTHEVQTDTGTDEGDEGESTEGETAKEE
jgi:large subunit ribosomal protein L25